MITKQKVDQYAKVAVAIFVSIGLILGLIGAAERHWNDDGGIFTMVVAALHLYIPRPNIVSNSSEPFAFRAAAVMCGLSGFVAAGSLWLYGANRTLRDLWTQFFRRGHILLVGDSPFLAQLHDALLGGGKDAVLVRSPNISGVEEAALKVGFLPSRLQSRAGLKRACAVVLDAPGDAETLSLAKPLLSHLKSEGGISNKQVALRISDQVIGDQFLDVLHRTGLDSVAQISSFDENAIIARRTLATYPLFVRASAREQRRVHALIVGFGDLGEKLLDQIMLTSLSGDLETPKVTIVDRDANRLKRAFLSRRSGVIGNLPISFHELDVGCDPLDDADQTPILKELKALERADPFTAVMLALGDQAEVMRTGLLLDRARQRTGSFCAPIFYRCRLMHDAEDLLESNIPALTATEGFIKMSASPEDYIAAILGNPVLDGLAVALHDRYRLGPLVTPEADRDWNDLAETYRRANRRAADHLVAKLWTIGVRVEPDVSNWQPSVADVALLKRLVSAEDDAPELLALCRLEHARWTIDRRLDGWVQGDKKDPVRKTHTLFVPYEDLQKTPDEIRKDLEQVQEMLRFVLERS